MRHDGRRPLDAAPEVLPRPPQSVAAGRRAGTGAVIARVRLTLAILILGAFCVVLAALPYKTFELDRYFVPKELVLHLTATIAVMLSIVGVRQFSLTRVDTLLLAYVGLSVLSACFATNWWLAERALAMTCSGVALFWVARWVAQSGLRWPLLVGLTAAILVGTATALAQAYGVVGDYASLSRAPGGTFGNRNFMAHLVAIGLPILLLCIARAKRAWFALGTLLVVVFSAALMLSRTRAAWVALLVGGVMCGPAAWWLWRRRITPSKRLWTVVLAAAIGVAAALLLPNTLEWKSDSPYLDSMRGVVNYKEGSGHGRVLQYRRTLMLAAHHPVLGVGPGNWPVAYPGVAPETDPSIDQDNGMASNPWPSSDWMAILSERGVLATLVYVVAMIALVVGAWREWRSTDNRETRMVALALGATVIVTAVVGMFDAVLLIAIPSLFVWCILGALVPSMPVRHVVSVTDGRRRWGVIAALVVGGIFSLRSAGGVMAMTMYDPSRISAAAEAVWFDPGSYRIRIHLAELYARRGECKGVRTQAGAAHRLFPAAPEPMRLLRRCG